MKAARFREIVEGFASKKVLVIGDLILDRYVTGTVGRISPEAPVPVVHVTEEHNQPGGAANVALNIQSLGGQALVSGLTGSDSLGQDLRQLLAQAGISTEAVVDSADIHTTVKTRVVAERQQVVRVDRESLAEDVNGLSEVLCERIAGVMDGVDGIIIEDYGKGAITQKVVDAVLKMAAESGIPVALDPKDNHELLLKGLALATPNYKEACAAAGVRETPIVADAAADPTLMAASRELREHWDPDLLLITLGAKGMYISGRDGEPEVMPTKAQEVFDVSGAGDTVIAAACLALLAGADHREAAEVANHAAGIVVGKLGTATCTDTELLGTI